MRKLLVAQYLSILLAPCLAQNISAKKCIEYSETVFQMEQVQVLTLEPKFKKIDTCGITSSPLIVGGVQAHKKEFPHMAAIGFSKEIKEKPKWECGGTLIGRRFVVTAAHCAKSRTGEPHMVRLGAVNFDEEAPYMQEILISKFVSHPKYKKPSAYYDIAIIFLASSVEFTAYVRPACLNTLEQLPTNILEATGFGKLDQFDSTGSSKLMKVNLNIIDKDVCNKYVVDKVILPNGLSREMLCAGNLENGGKDTCQGDSGGPLHYVLTEPYCMYSIVGLTSFGKTCGLEYSPGVYTKISSFVPWIESVCWGEQD